MFDKEKACAFTGHRPEKLHISENEAKSQLCNSIESAIKLGYTTFITGCARGVDTWAGEIVLDFKNIYPTIRLVCALPFPDFAKNAPHLVEQADFVHVISQGYSLHTFQARNRWMVDNASLLIAFFTGEKGGTENTVKYAQNRGLEIMWIRPNSIFRQIKMHKIYE